MAAALVQQQQSEVTLAHKQSELIEEKSEKIDAEVEPVRQQDAIEVAPSTASRPFFPSQQPADTFYSGAQDTSVNFYNQSYISYGNGADQQTDYHSSMLLGENSMATS